MRKVEREVFVGHIRRIPCRQVHLQLPAGRAPREHVLHRERDSTLRVEPLDAFDEFVPVLLLPTKRRVDHDGVRAQPLGGLARDPQLLPRIGAPRVLRDDQHRCVNGVHLDLVILAQLLDRVDVG